MKEINDIVKAFDLAVQDGKQCALATVVLVEGSSYRRPGARMLVTEDGDLTGAISGGCLEGDALRKARYAIMSRENSLVIYDTTDEDDVKFGVQLGCNGIVHILFEPLYTDAQNDPINLLRQLLTSRENAVVATFFSPRAGNQPGTRLLYRKGKIMGQQPENLNSDIEAGVKAAFEQQVSRFEDYPVGNGLIKVFFEFIAPPVALVIAGAGNDVQPVVEMADLLGWDITVVDGRVLYATAARFPKATQVLLTRPAGFLSQIQVDAQTVFLLMTHNYTYDLALLKELSTINYSYIGMLGPAQKRDRMLADLRDEGISLTADQRSRIYGPVGLDIGAETATEIALSVLAEVKAFVAARPGGSLKLKAEPIHSRSANSLHHE
jgi:xanthine dehydrogenase accessory factor